MSINCQPRLCPIHHKYSAGYCEFCLEFATARMLLDSYHGYLQHQAARKLFVCQHGTGSQTCDCYAEHIYQQVKDKE
jgi:hypothetical protein